MNNQNVTLYISDHDKAGYKVKELIERYGVDYQLKNVSHNREHMKELQRKGVYGTPTIFVANDSKPILGYQESRIIKAIKKFT